MIMTIDNYKIRIDLDEKWRIEKYKYHAKSWPGSQKIYFERHTYLNKKQKTYMLHREIANTPAGMECDHINGNEFDCRKINMRNATHAQNQRNKGKQKNNTSGYKGVSYNKQSKKWVAFIIANKRQIHLGYYGTPTLAHFAYIEASKKYHKEFARAT